MVAPQSGDGNMVNVLGMGYSVIVLCAILDIRLPHWSALGNIPEQVHLDNSQRTLLRAALQKCHHLAWGLRFMWPLKFGKGAK